MQNGSFSQQPPPLIGLEIREVAIYARIAALIAADPSLTSIYAAEVSEDDIRAAADQSVIRDTAILFENALKTQIAAAAIRVAEKRLQKADHD